jgi:predicted O-methyltransferase YrrM
MVASPGDFGHYHGQWQRIDGFLAEHEGRWLFEAARDVQIEGDVVEIGSFMGRSTICLGLGTKLNNQSTQSEAKVFAVDPHTGGIGYVEKYPDAPEKLYSLGPFLQNLVDFKVQDVVVPLVQRSEDAFGLWSRGAVRLLFIDGWHSYETCYFDITNWGSLVAPGGLIAVHDYEWDDVKEALHASLSQIDCARVELVGSNLAVLRRGQ